MKKAMVLITAICMLIMGAMPVAASAGGMMFLDSNAKKSWFIVVIILVLGVAAFLYGRFGHRDDD